jgi:hypothetical protein
MVVQVLPSEEDSQVQVTEVTAPSGSEREALSAESTRGVPGTERAPASSALVTLMVTSMVSSAAVSAVPPASLLSLTETMTEYKALVSKSRAPLVCS